MKWKVPHVSKVYEALGCLADNRLRIENGEVKVYSSSGNKFYNINYSEKENAIMCNDNNSYFNGSLGYPSIAYLMHIGKIKFNSKFSEALKGIKWKDLNQKFKNNFDLTIEHIKNGLLLKGMNLKELDAEINSVFDQIKKLDINLLGEKTKPPKGY